MRDLIYCQRDIPREELRYGFRSSAATGCGWIATYNALRLLGRRAKKEELIRYYERQLPLIHGNGGTSFWGPAAFFRHHGFRVTMEVRRVYGWIWPVGSSLPTHVLECCLFSP